MAGSLRWFRYSTTPGDDFAILADESNVESVNGARAQLAVGALIYAAPRNIELRVALYRNLSGTITRRVPLLDDTVNAALQFTDQVSGEVVRLQSIQGESIRLPSDADTGLQDGDNP